MVYTNFIILKSDSYILGTEDDSMPKPLNIPLFPSGLDNLTTINKVLIHQKDTEGITLLSFVLTFNYLI